MAYTISHYGTHDVVLPATRPTGAKIYNIRTPWWDEVTVQPFNVSGTTSPTRIDAYEVKWMGDKLNTPAGNVIYRPLPSRPLYKATDKIPETSRIKMTSAAKCVSASSNIYLEDVNNATGEVLKVPFRMSLTLECPWDYPGMDQQVFETAFEICLGLLLTKFSSEDGPEQPGDSSLQNSLTQWEDMFADDMNPRSNNLE